MYEKLSCLAICSLLAAAPAQAAAPPDFHAAFDGSADARSSEGKLFTPKVSGPLNYRPGIAGKAVRPGDESTLQFDADGLFGQAGAVMFWFSPDWDGLETETVTHPLFEALGADGKSKINLFMWNWLRCDIGRRDTTQEPAQFNRFGRNLWFAGDWIHLAVRWDEKGNISLFVNGLPYLPANNWAGDGKPVPDADIAAITRFALTGKSAGAYDEFKLLRRKVSNVDVWQEYRARMPIDIVLPRAILDPSRADQVVLRLAPGGEYMRPIPVNLPPNQAKVDIRAELLALDGRVFAERRATVEVDKASDFALPAVRLAPGEYRVRCSIAGPDGTMQRTFRVTAATPVAAPVPVKEDIKTGKLLFEKKFTTPDDPALLRSGATSGSPGGYLEAGNNKGDRFAVVIPFPEEFRQGDPVLLEVTWPDDKPRMMGLYMYKETPHKQHRDRLQGGIQAGNEYPNSGGMIKTRYLFFPGTPNYLFEARTMATGFPAAVAEVRVFAIDGGLPALKIHAPEGIPGRTFGHMDEDQTFESNLNYDRPQIVGSVLRTPLLTDELLKYFDYTGQNTMHYPVLRYDYTFYTLDGHPGNGMYPFRAGELPYVAEAFGKRGKTLVGILNLTNLPEASKFPRIEADYEKRGLFVKDKEGKDVASFAAGEQTANFAHPEVRRMYFTHVNEIVTQLGRTAGFEGLELWINQFGAWQGLDVGYDDWTVSAFSADTAIAVPDKNRYEFLTGEKREEWLRWRSRQVTKFVAELRELMNRTNPELKLYIAINESAIDELGGIDLYADRGIDAEALKQIKNVFPVPIRYSTSYRWGFHWGKPEGGVDELLYDRNGKEPFLVDGAAEATVTYPSYFETWETSLDNQRFSAYFENADVKPHGRFFLKEFAYNIAVLDAQRMVVGAQPLGTMGRDAETREFTQAYSALPQQRFTTVPGSPDPVAVRFLQTENGTYFYVASMLFTDSTVKLELPEDLAYLDLSTDRTEKGAVIELKPFQLRSFLIPDQKVSLTGFTVKADDAAKFYRAKLAELRKGTDLLEQQKLDVKLERETLAAIDAAIADGRFAEAHRQSFSRTMNQIGKKIASMELLLKQERMIADGHWAVNCGSTGFYQGKDGRLFFPDQRYSDAGRYGYFGNYNSVVRGIEKIKEENIPGIYQHEAYDIDGYRFKLPDGKYTVRLYLKIGYAPGFYAERFTFTVSAQGKPLFTDVDMFKAGKEDFLQPIMMEFKDIEVEGGMLTLSFREAKGRNSDARLCNAIEVIRQK